MVYRLRDRKKPGNQDLLSGGRGESNRSPATRTACTCCSRATSGSARNASSTPSPVIATVVGEIYGRPDHSYNALSEAAKVLRARLEAEPGVVDVDDSVEADETKLVFRTDKEKAALNGVTECTSTYTCAKRGGATP